jgi:phospholipase C
MSLNDIETIVVVILENRSFDHVLGYRSLTAAGAQTNGLRNDAAWRAKYANPFKGAFHESHPIDLSLHWTDDPSHTSVSIHHQIETPAQGAARMGGFVESFVTYAKHPPTDPSAVMGYYDRSTVPVFEFFADNYAVCDNWFAALPAGTQPNRLMAMSGESLILENRGLFLPKQRLVYDWLTDHKIDWCAYQWGDFFPFFSLSEQHLPEILFSLTLKPAHGPFRRYSHFKTSWRSNQPMPSVIFIEPEYGDGPHKDPCDDHPPISLAKGQVFLADVYQTLISNADRWANTMMVITYDEHGGFFDHVEPLPIPAQAGGAQVATTGVRVPGFVISPHVAPGSVFKGELDHTSILQLLDDRFSPGEGYSVAVNERQKHLNRLLNTLEPPSASPRAPTIPNSVLQSLKATAQRAPVPPPEGASPTDPANAQAFHQVAVQAAQQHPELMSKPQWRSVNDYLDLI